MKCQLCLLAAWWSGSLCGCYKSVPIDFTQILSLPCPPTASVAGIKQMWEFIVAGGQHNPPEFEQVIVRHRDAMGLQRDPEFFTLEVKPYVAYCSANLSRRLSGA